MENFATFVNSKIFPAKSPLVNPPPLLYGLDPPLVLGWTLRFFGGVMSDMKKLCGVIKNRTWFTKTASCVVSSVNPCGIGANGKGSYGLLQGSGLCRLALVELVGRVAPVRCLCCVHALALKARRFVRAIYTLTVLRSS